MDRLSTAVNTPNFNGIRVSYQIKHSDRKMKFAKELMAKMETPNEEGVSLVDFMEQRGKEIFISAAQKYNHLRVDFVPQKSITKSKINEGTVYPIDSSTCYGTYKSAKDFDSEAAKRSEIEFEEFSKSLNKSRPSEFSEMSKGDKKANLFTRFITSVKNLFS